MTLAVNHTEEKDANWADLIDGLRYDGFRRSVSGVKPESPEVYGTDGAAPVGGAKRKVSDSEPS
jgi:hypothetical protein